MNIVQPVQGQQLQRTLIQPFDQSKKQGVFVPMKENFNLNVTNTPNRAFRTSYQQQNLQTPTNIVNRGESIDENQLGKSNQKLSQIVKLNNQGQTSETKGQFNHFLLSSPENRKSSQQMKSSQTPTSFRQSVNLNGGGITIIQPNFQQPQQHLLQPSQIQNLQQQPAQQPNLRIQKINCIQPQQQLAQQQTLQQQNIQPSAQQNQSQQQPKQQQMTPQKSQNTPLLSNNQYLQPTTPQQYKQQQQQFQQQKLQQLQQTGANLQQQIQTQGQGQQVLLNKNSVVLDQPTLYPLQYQQQSQMQQMQPVIQEGNDKLQEKIEMLLNENKRLNDLVLKKFQENEQLKKNQNNDSLRHIELKVNNLQDLIKQQNEEIEMYKAKNQYSIQQEQELMDQKQLTEKYKNSFEKVEERIGQILEENNKLADVIQQKEQESGDLQNKVQLLLEDNTKLTSALQEKQDSDDEQIKQLIEENDKLNQLLEEKANQIIEFQQQYGQFLESIDKEKQEKEQELQNKQQLINDMQNHLNNVQEQLGKLKDYSLFEEKMNQVIEENEKMAQALEECQDTIMQLKQENQQSIDLQDNTQKDLEQIKKQNETYSMVVEELKQQFFGTLQRMNLL